MAATQKVLSRLHVHPALRFCKLEFILSDFINFLGLKEGLLDFEKFQENWLNIF